MGTQRILKYWFCLSQEDSSFNFNWSSFESFQTCYPNIWVAYEKQDIAEIITKTTNLRKIQNDWFPHLWQTLDKGSPDSPLSDAHPPDLLRGENSELDGFHLFHRRLRVIGVDGRHPATHRRPTLWNISTSRRFRVEKRQYNTWTARTVVADFTTSSERVHLARHFVTHCGVARLGPGVWFGRAFCN